MFVRSITFLFVSLLFALILICETHQTSPPSSSSSSSSSSPSDQSSQNAPIRSRPSFSNILKRALLKTFAASSGDPTKRVSKWNEFMEEAQNKPNKTQTNVFEESIVMSSNLGQSAQAGGSSPSHPKDPLNPINSILLSKLFNNAFLTAPTRVMQTTRRPLVTYVNISNLEEHEEVGNRLSPISLEKINELPLLNNAESFVTKKRLPECATQQVCAAHYVKSNHTQRLCECPAEFNWSCNDNTLEHTIELSNNPDFNRIRNSSFDSYTQVRMCENLKTLKSCKQPTDWTIMALQSERTAKAHYVVACKCPESALFEGPFTHKHPPYARFPGIRVYGMLCNQGNRKYKEPKAMEIDNQNTEDYPEFPWDLAYAILNATSIDW